MSTNIIINSSFFISDELPDFLDIVLDYSSPNSIVPKYDLNKKKTDEEVYHDRCLSAILCSGGLLIMILILMAVALLFRRVIESFTSNESHQQGFAQVPSDNIDE